MVSRLSIGGRASTWLPAYRQWFALFAVAIVFAAVRAPEAAAQTSVSEPTADATSSADVEKSSTGAATLLTAPPQANEHVIFVDENGEVVRLTAGGQIGEYLRWREELLKNADDKRPGYYVAAITLAGTVNDRRTLAVLDASIEVFVRGDVDHVEVPLRLNEATLLKHRHTDSNDVEFLPTDRGTGLKCRISKPGQHRIDLQLSVPVRKSGNTYRVRLSLPGTAQSSLRLVVPGEAIAIRAARQADIEVERLADGNSALVMHGLEALMDLPWQVVSSPLEERTVLQSETLLAADAGIDGVSVEAVQTITATSGSFNSVRVAVPPGFNVLDVSSSTHESIRTSDLQMSPVEISLPENTTGPLRLNWLLSSETRADASLISIGGFNVEGATRQETLFGITAAEGFRLSQLAPRPQQVQRISTSLFRKRVETQFDPQFSLQQAYRLTSVNARVQFRIERIEASYRVSPAYEITFRESSAALVARFDIVVYRGALDFLSLKWPEHLSQEWGQFQVVEADDRAHLAGRPVQGEGVPTAGPNTEELRIEFVEPLNRTHGVVSVELLASRPVPLGEEPFLISMPMADSEAMPVSHVTLLNADNVESTIAGARETDVRFLSDGTRLGTTETSDIPLNLVPRKLESASSTLEFLATVTTHDQDVVSASHAILTLSENEIAAEQRLRYSVAYEAIDRLRILVPGSVKPDGFRLMSRDDETSTPLTAEVGGLEIDGVRQIRVDLPEPLLGQFAVACTYQIPVDSAFASSGTAKLEIPLLQPSEITGDTTRVEIRSPGNVEVQVAGEQWTQELTLSNAPSWLASGMLRSVDLSLEAAPDRATQNFVVRRSALRTRFQNGSAIRTTGVYLIDGEISFLTVTLPASMDQASLRAWWDGRTLPIENLLISTAENGTTEVRILVEEQPGQSLHTLALEFDVLATGHFTGSNELYAIAPQFAADVWLADTVWELVLPVDQHLLVYPENYTPAFSWQRQGLSWSRRSVALGQSLSRWLLPDIESESEELRGLLETQLSDLQFDPLVRMSYGNSYLFSAFGHQQQVQIRTISQPAVILAGAGLALALGLVLLRIPATRHVITVLVIGFGLSVGGLWCLEAVQLLLQPAVFGLVLAVIASVIESRIKRKQRASLVTFSSPSDFMVPGSSREEIIHDESGELSERPA